MINTKLTTTTLFVVVPFVLGAFSIPVLTEGATLVYQNSFENGWGDVMFRGFCSSTNAIERTFFIAEGETLPSGHDQFMRTTSYARSGSYSARTMLHPRYACIGDDTNLLKIRSEIAMGRNWNTIYRFTDNVEHWYGVSLMIDANSSLNNPPRAIMQQMKQPGTNNSLSNQGGRWEYYYLTSYNSGQSVDLGPIEKGEWTDFVYRIKPSTSGGNGFIEIWVNGVKEYSNLSTNIIITDSGGTASNVTNGAYYGNYG